MIPQKTTTRSPKATTRALKTAAPVVSATGRPRAMITINRFFSMATGRPVSERWARNNPTKVMEGVHTTTGGPLVVGDKPRAKVVKAVKKVAKKAVKKTRLVKRVKSGKKGGTFAKKTSTGGNVRTDFIDAIPTPKVKKAVKKATKKIVKQVKSLLALPANSKAAKAVKKVVKTLKHSGGKAGSKVALRKGGTRGG